jgi:transposase
MNELSMQEQEAILSLLRLGWSRRRIARETGHRRETITRYARAAGLLPPPPIAGSKPATEAEVPTDSRLGVEAEVPAGSKPAIEGEVPNEHSAVTTKSRSSCEVHRPFIEAEVSKGRNGMAIFQDLVEQHGYEGSYDAVKRFVRSIVSRTPKISCRFETLPGQDAQVDFGEGAPTRDARNGKYRKPRLFVLSLSFSRHAFRKVVWRSSQQIWCELHEEAFAHFGGVPEWIRLANLKEGVIEPDIYDPELNKLYAAVLNYCDIIALPCRPYAPDLKRENRVPGFVRTRHGSQRQTL